MLRAVLIFSFIEKFIKNFLFLTLKTYAPGYRAGQRGDGHKLLYLVHFIEKSAIPPVVVLPTKTGQMFGTFGLGKIK